MIYSKDEKSNIIEYICDTVDDVQNLPITADPGSIAFVIEDTSIFILSNTKEWRQIL